MDIFKARIGAICIQGGGKEKTIHKSVLFEGYETSWVGAITSGMSGEESKLQSKIIKYLKLKGWLPVKISLCSVNGWPDVYAIKKGRSLFIEVKKPGEEPAPLQQHVHAQIELYGGIVWAIDNYEEFKKKLFWYKF